MKNNIRLLLNKITAPYEKQLKLYDAGNTKIGLKTLHLEITRRCNMACPHCCRNSAENLDMSKEIIDKVFNKNFKKRFVVNYLVFSGGEPTLNPGLISYTVNKLIKNSIAVSELSVIINGSIYSQEMVDAFQKYKKAFPFSKISIRLSNDNFHENPNRDALAQYYNLNFFRWRRTYLSKDKLRYVGRAKKLLGKPNNSDEREFKIPPLYLTRQTVLGGKTRLFADNNDGLYITAKGNLVTTGFGEYEQLDAQSFGNVLVEPMEKIMLKNTERLIPLHDWYPNLSSEDVELYKKAWKINEM